MFNEVRNSHIVILWVFSTFTWCIQNIRIDNDVLHTRKLIFSSVQFCSVTEFVSHSHYDVCATAQYSYVETFQFSAGQRTLSKCQ